MTKDELPAMEAVFRELQERGITCAYSLTSWTVQGTPVYAWKFRTERLHEPIVLAQVITVDELLDREALFYARARHFGEGANVAVDAQNMLFRQLAKIYRAQLFHPEEPLPDCIDIDFSLNVTLQK